MSERRKALFWSKKGVWETKGAVLEQERCLRDERRCFGARPAVHQHAWVDEVQTWTRLYYVDNCVGEARPRLRPNSDLQL